MYKLLLVGLWPIAAITTLTVTILFFITFPSGAGSVKGAKTAQDVEKKSSYKLFTALPVEASVEESMKITDARVEIVKQFLNRYDSSLESHAKLLVETADTYHLDFRLLPAVAMQESTLCKKIPPGSFNCWGYGIYDDNVLRFESYEQAIEAVGKGISSDYIFDGLTTPEMIMKRYTPSSNGSWAEAVRGFMEEME